MKFYQIQCYFNHSETSESDPGSGESVSFRHSVDECRQIVQRLSDMSKMILSNVFTQLVVINYYLEESHLSSSVVMEGVG